MALNYTTKFQIKPGTWVFVPDSEARNRGKEIVRWVLRRWSPPKYYYHYRRGGHLRAISAHSESRYFIRADIERFFDHVTRSKVVRALKEISFSNRDAFELSQDCVVKKPDRDGLSIPFGFVQSPIISSLVMDKSALGRAFHEIRNLGVKISVYVDDILLSHSNSPDALVDARSILDKACTASGFVLNTDKSTDIVDLVKIFNIDVGINSVRISNEKMDELILKLASARSEKVISGILSYIRSVNVDQLAGLGVRQGS